MITPVYTITVDDRNLMLHVEQLPMALKTKLRPVIASLTAQLLARVRASEPRRTGQLLNLTRAYVNESEDSIRGRVRVLAPAGQAFNIGAAALEYGIHKSMVEVKAYRRESVAVKAYTRHARLAARRFLRGPAEAFREQAMTEIRTAVDEAVQSVSRINREIIMGALFSKLTSPPLVFGFAADTTTGSVTLANVSNTTGLMVGMPVMGDGLAGNVTIATITPSVTVSLPAIADRTASPMIQGFQTSSRRLADPSVEQDMPALYLIEVSEMHGARGSDEPTLVEINCEAWIYTRAGADQNAIPVSTLNTLIDGIERVLYPTPRAFWQNLGLRGVAYCRIEGEITKDPGYDGQIAGAIVPIKLVVSQTEDTIVMS